MSNEKIESFKKIVYEICKKYDIPTTISFED